MGIENRAKELAERDVKVGGGKFKLWMLAAAGLGLVVLVAVLAGVFGDGP